MAIDRNNVENNDSTLDLRGLLMMCLAHWRWFVLSLAICLGGAVYYILKTPPVFTRSESILIKEEGGGGRRSFSSQLSSGVDLGMFNNHTNVYNELEFMKSPALILEVVKRLNLEMNYTEDGTFHLNTLYGRNLPIKVSIPDFPDNKACSFTLHISKGKKLTLSKFTMSGQEEIDETIQAKGQLGDTISTPVGNVCIEKSPYFKDEDNQDRTIYVTRSSMLGSISTCLGRLGAGILSEKPPSSNSHTRMFLSSVQRKCSTLWYPSTTRIG